MTNIKTIRNNLIFRSKYNGGKQVEKYFNNRNVLYDAIFASDIFENVDFSNKTFYGCFFHGVMIRGVVFKNTMFKNCIFNRCSITECDFTGASFIDANFIEGNCYRNKNLRIHDVNPIAFLEDCTKPVQAFKMVNKSYTSPMYGHKKYTVGTIVEEKIYNSSPEESCGAGLNVATLQWIKSNWFSGAKLLLVEFNPKDIVAVPYNTSGKFRVKKLKVVKELDPSIYGLS